MATTTTPRLGLKKQANADNPGAWDVDLNAGFDDADARFFRTGTDDPNVAETGDYVSQRYHRTTDDYWWTCTIIGSPGTWVSDFETIDDDVNHPAPPTTLALDYTHNDLQCVLEWLTNSEVQLRPIGGNVMFYDSTGVRVTFAAGSFIFDISTDREGAQTEDASTPYYLYLDNDTTPGTPLPVVSKTVPLEIGTATPGYHPTLTDHRCVGSIWNDSGSDISKFNTMFGGMIRFDGITRDHTDHTDELFKSATPAFRNQTLNIPLTATHVVLQIGMKMAGSQGWVAIAQDGAASVGLPSDNGPHRLSDSEFVEASAILHQGGNGYAFLEITLDIPTRSAPAFNYGHNHNLLDMLSAVTIGYIDLWAPKEK